MVVSAPTGSGKTLVAEAAIVAALSAGKRVFYTTPLKALSNQKLREFRARFGEDRVGLRTGDGAVNRDAPLVVLTTEILRNMLYGAAGAAAGEGAGAADDRLQGVSFVVLDEVGSTARGPAAAPFFSRENRYRPRSAPSRLNLPALLACGALQPTRCTTSATASAAPCGRRPSSTAPRTSSSSP